MDSFEVFLDDTRKIVRLTAAGIIDYPVLEKMIDTARRTAVETGYNILYDVRQAQTKVALGNWFFIPRDLEIFKASRSQKAIAVILASTADKGVKGYKFHTTALGNLGDIKYVCSMRKPTRSTSCSNTNRKTKAIWIL